jgi:hypothetical protein
MQRRIAAAAARTLLECSDVCFVSRLVCFVFPCRPEADVTFFWFCRDFLSVNRGSEAASELVVGWMVGWLVDVIIGPIHKLLSNTNNRFAIMHLPLF